MEIIPDRRRPVGPKEGTCFCLLLSYLRKCSQNLTRRQFQSSHWNKERQEPPKGFLLLPPIGDAAEGCVVTGRGSVFLIWKLEGKISNMREADFLCTHLINVINLPSVS